MKETKENGCYLLLLLLLHAGGRGLTNQAQRHVMPPNYVAFLEFIKCVSKALLVILGLGTHTN